MVERRQLPPQIKRIELGRRAGGRPVVRYQLTVDVGIVDGKRKQLRKRYANEQEARKVLDEIRGDVARGTYVHVTELTVDKAIEDWLLSRHGIKAKSKSGYAGVLAPVRSELGHLSIQKLTRRDIDGLIQRLRDGSVARAKGEGRRRKWGARSCNYMLVALSQVFKQLVKDGTVVRNIVEDVDRVPGRPKKFDTYTPAQVDCVLRAIREDRNRHAWHLALCGLRRGEIGGLRWTNVDLEAHTLTIGPTRISVDGKAIEQDDAKSEDSHRTLPIPDPLRAELKAAHKRQAEEELALGAAYRRHGYVVCNEAGEPYHPDTLSKMWTKAVATAGVPHIRLHDARHTCGTTMHLQGVPPAVIAAWLGHADVAFTMRTYVHSQPDALAEGAHSLARVVTIRDSLPGS
ncbi:tyrosine-type recombinase/integrase [Mycobacterium sp.]|uniref:tyrosine-type recombinase/integrase n=1 Tax=Mycobacterium sp. TaxID=1785 RepID=UPI003F952A80